MSRRGALLAAVGTTTVACSPYDLQTQQRRPPRPTPTTAEPPPADPDIELAATVVAAERAVLERIEATVRAHPRLERLLAAARDVHVAHVALLRDAVPAEPAPADEETGGPTTPSLNPSEAPTPSGRVPRDPARALRSVAAAEDELALTAKQAAFSAESGAFARVLASMAAAAAQQSAVLRGARVRGAGR